MAARTAQGDASYPFPFVDEPVRREGLTARRENRFAAVLYRWRSALGGLLSGRKRMSTIITHLLLKNVRCFAGEQRAAAVQGNPSRRREQRGQVHVPRLCERRGSPLQSRGAGRRREQFRPKAFLSWGHSRTSCDRAVLRFSLASGWTATAFASFNVEFAGGPGGGLRETTLDVELSDDRPNARAALQNQLGGAALPRTLTSGGVLTGPGSNSGSTKSDVSYRQFTTWLSRSVRYGLLPFGGEMTQYRKRVGGKVSDQEARRVRKVRQLLPTWIPSTRSSPVGYAHRSEQLGEEHGTTPSTRWESAMVARTPTRSAT